MNACEESEDGWGEFLSLVQDGTTPKLNGDDSVVRQNKLSSFKSIFGKPIVNLEPNLRLTRPVIVRLVDSLASCSIAVQKRIELINSPISMQRFIVDKAVFMDWLDSLEIDYYDCFAKVNGTRNKCGFFANLIGCLALALDKIRRKTLTTAAICYLHILILDHVNCLINRIKSTTAGAAWFNIQTNYKILRLNSKNLINDFDNLVSNEKLLNLEKLHSRFVNDAIDPCLTSTSKYYTNISESSNQFSDTVIKLTISDITDVLILIDIEMGELELVEEQPQVEYDFVWPLEEVDLFLENLQESPAIVVVGVPPEAIVEDFYFEQEPEDSKQVIATTVPPATDNVMAPPAPAVPAPQVIVIAPPAPPVNVGDRQVNLNFEKALSIVLNKINFHSPNTQSVDNLKPETLKTLILEFKMFSCFGIDDTFFIGGNFYCVKKMVHCIAKELCEKTSSMSVCYSHIISQHEPTGCKFNNAEQVRHDLVNQYGGITGRLVCPSIMKNIHCWAGFPTPVTSYNNPDAIPQVVIPIDYQLNENSVTLDVGSGVGVFTSMSLFLNIKATIGVEIDPLVSVASMHNLRKTECLFKLANNIKVLCHISCLNMLEWYRFPDIVSHVYCFVGCGDLVLGMLYASIHSGSNLKILNLIIPHPEDYFEFLADIPGEEDKKVFCITGGGDMQFNHFPCFVILMSNARKQLWRDKLDEIYRGAAAPLFAQAKVRHAIALENKLIMSTFEKDLDTEFSFKTKTYLEANRMANMANCETQENLHLFTKAALMCSDRVRTVALNSYSKELYEMNYYKQLGCAWGERKSDYLKFEVHEEEAFLEKQKSLPHHKQRIVEVPVAVSKSPCLRKRKAVKQSPSSLQIKKKKVETKPVPQIKPQIPLYSRENSEAYFTIVMEHYKPFYCNYVDSLLLFTKDYDYTTTSVKKVKRTSPTSKKKRKSSIKSWYRKRIVPKKTISSATQVDAPLVAPALIPASADPAAIIYIN